MTGMPLCLIFQQLICDLVLEWLLSHVPGLLDLTQGLEALQEAGHWGNYEFGRKHTLRTPSGHHSIPWSQRLWISVFKPQIIRMRRQA
jgi:hypothetical protein